MKTKHKLNKETFPKGNVWIQQTGVEDAAPSMVVGIYNKGVSICSFGEFGPLIQMPWYALVEEGEYSTDGRETWTKFSEGYVTELEHEN